MNIILPAVLTILLIMLDGSGAVPKYCSYRSHPGMCLMGVKRFYWDKRSNKCRQFHYNGRFGNANRFATLDECRSACDVRRKYEAIYM
ncbi:kunitz-type serine protease inhibitor dendrotoxin DaE1-like isoform X1 [Dermacentor silvarum]|uniref:kunitz-type serine protease inhibitor dendrotoxin DaE1-like isoform X1 n=1 Tax=Dermacentor silvarum TaxID=543639 RepID=UPI002100B2D8|nr:kunitz-type serine protease inhibitor dendrotoxin DaE1-like isoform X1 [Dermacentor silvarum]